MRSKSFALKQLFFYLYRQMNKETTELILDRLNYKSNRNFLFYIQSYPLKELFKNSELVHELMAGCGDETAQYGLWKLNKFGKAKTDMYLSYGQIIGSCDYCSINKNTSLLKQFEDNLWRSGLFESLEDAAKDYIAKIKAYWDIEQYEVNEVKKELESAHDLDLSVHPQFQVNTL